MILRIKKIVGASAAVGLVAAWLLHGLLKMSYVDYPRTPDPATGRTVPYATIGIVVYISQGQDTFLTRLVWIEVCSGAIMALVLLLHGGDPFRSK